MNPEIERIAESALGGKGVSREEALQLARVRSADWEDLIFWADRIREKHKGRGVKLCSIVPVRMGGCNQDCKFCAQSIHYEGSATKSKHAGPEAVLAAAQQARKEGVSRIGLVCSGRKPRDGHVDELARLAESILLKTNLSVCVSAGAVSIDQARRLKDAGVTRYNHNLETSADFYSSLVSTHSWHERRDTLFRVRDGGLELCSGGIFGVGEGWEDRIDLAMSLRSFSPEMIPVNFLHPISGTPLGSMPVLSVREGLKILAIFRFIFPVADLKVAGGRERILGSGQGRMFAAGANSILTGDYLSTKGISTNEDLTMLRDTKMYIAT